MHIFWLDGLYHLHLNVNTNSYANFLFGKKVPDILLIGLVWFWTATYSKWQFRKPLAIISNTLSVKLTSSVWYYHRETFLSLFNITQASVNQTTVSVWLLSDSSCAAGCAHSDTDNSYSLRIWSKAFFWKLWWESLIVLLIITVGRYYLSIILLSPSLSEILYTSYCSSSSHGDGLSLCAREKYRGDNSPSLSPGVSNTPFSDQ